MWVVGCFHAFHVCVSIGVAVCVYVCLFVCACVCVCLYVCVITLEALSEVTMGMAYLHIAGHIVGTLRPSTNRMLPLLRFLQKKDRRILLNKKSCQITHHTQKMECTWSRQNNTLTVDGQQRTELAALNHNQLHNLLIPSNYTITTANNS